MNELVLPTFACLFIFLICLLISKHFKDSISTIMFSFFGIVSMLLLIKMLYGDLIIPQEWWKEVIVIPGILILLIILAALEGFGIISYIPEPTKKL